MGKTHRGKGLIKLPAHGRGTCPICMTKRIKILYTVMSENGEQLKVCKRCRNKKLNQSN